MDHALQDLGRTRPLGLSHAAHHSDLDGSDRNGRLRKAPSTARREPRGKNLPDGCLCRPGHVAVSFEGLETTPIAFALRDVIPGTDLASVAQPGIGTAIWLHATDVQAIHDALVADGRTIVSAPIDGPFGRTFTFADPDGYQVTLHDRA